MSNGRKKRFLQIISFYEVHPYPLLKEYRNKDMKKTLEAEVASKIGKTQAGADPGFGFGGMLCAKATGNSRSESQKFSSPPRLVSKFPKIPVMKIPPRPIHPVRRPKLKVIITIVIYLQFY